MQMLRARIYDMELTKRQGDIASTENDGLHGRPVTKIRTIITRKGVTDHRINNGVQHAFMTAISKV